jgi:membrane-bound metal-dependent hydrolase YbcI (DUF457 family)
MFIFGHIGVTLGVFFGLGIFLPRLKTIIDPKYLVIGALLPDLIDKPLGRVIFASTIANGRIIGHTLLFALLIFLMGLYLYEKRGDIKIISLATSSFFHLLEDQMWKTPITLFWPLFGLRFPKDYTDNSGIWYLIRGLENSFTFHFSQSSTPEILGLGVIVVLTLHWLINRFRQT